MHEAHAPPAAAADAPLVDTPQDAVLFLSTSDTRHIWLVRLMPKAAIYKTAGHADQEQTLSARPNLRAALKLLNGDVFQIDPRSGRFDRFDELTGRFAPLHRAAGNEPDDGHGEIHTEIAEGTGVDPAAALADAFRNAVRQAVGVYVDSETLTDKETVIADRVLTFSDAFVVRYKELSRSTEDGLVTIKISATTPPQRSCLCRSRSHGSRSTAAPRSMSTCRQCATASPVAGPRPGRRSSARACGVCRNLRSPPTPSPA